MTSDQPPSGASLALLGLWHAHRGDWEAAHQAVQQDETDPACIWVHAYLHRWEGDAANAAYWYRRAAKPLSSAELDAEWEEIAAALTT